MLVTSKTRWRLRADNLVFTVLFLAAVGLLAFLSTRYHLQADWTAGGRNSLSAASTELLQRLEEPVAITAYAREDELLRETIRDLVARYHRAGGEVGLEFVNPDEVPDRVRELGIAVDGELVVRYQGRTEHVQSHTEEALSNAIQRLARAGDRFLVFLTGHGERAPLGQANHDLGDFGRHLEQRGFNIQTLNLAEQGAIPDNTTVLVIAGPQVDLLPGEVERVQEFVAGGGNLLWLHDPGPDRGLGPVAEALGVEFTPGTIVDPTTRLFGIDHPAMVLVTGYPFHPVPRDFDLLTVFPQATGLAMDTPGEWDARAILTTTGNAWSETGELAGEVRFQEDSDLPGPLDIGFALTRERPTAGESPEEDSAGPREQRVAVLGDGDFLSNAFLGNGGNLDLGFNLMNWLSSDDRLLAIPAKTAPDTTLTLGQGASMVIGFGFLFALPAGLLGTGIAIWLRRRKR
jgi:ABC-type uncharacterized transport system involved in gliding motility auxiliary subunit